MRGGGCTGKRRRGWRRRFPLPEGLPDGRSEKNYEGNTHWLMFLFDCLKPLEHLPPPISEGEFALHEADAIDTLPIPETDRRALWPVYFNHRRDFVVLRADCTPKKPIEFQVEELIETAPPMS